MAVTELLGRLPGHSAGESGGAVDHWFWLKLLLALQFALVVGWVVSSRLAGPGLDTDNYVYLFKAPPGLSDGVSRFEPLFLLLVTGLRTFTRSPDTIFFAIAAIACLIKLFAVARLPGASLPVFALAYVATCMPLYEYNQIRVAVAIGFIYLAWNHLPTAPLRSALHFALALGFHYSSALFILPALIVVAARSRLAMIVGGVAIGLFAVASLVIDAPLVLQSYATGLMLRAAEMEGAEVNPLGFGVLLLLASTVVFAFARFELKAYVLLLCTFGLVLFAGLVRFEIPYAYRILETVAAVLPYGWARAFRGPALQKIAVGMLVAVAVAYAPILWGRLG
jgi:hypothetical protein